MISQRIIERKRDGETLSPAEIRFFIEGFTAGDIPDYQMAALAMAVYFRGMNADETVALTRAMTDSGIRLDFSGIPGPKIDKHSTGGIGDKVSLALAPIAAACGLRIPMISGRGLGLTGGTLDKLESIPGYRTDLSPDEFRAVVERVGCSIIGQTADLAPADRKLYALRDVTGTVPSIPLITASILSKKLAEDLDGLVLDVKCGRGAFMKTRAEAETLARSLREVAAGAGCPTTAIVTSMDEPLGRCAGNALEVRESIEILRGEGDRDLAELTILLAVEMILLGLPDSTRGDAGSRARDALESGRALEIFRRMIEAHGGEPRVVDDPGLLPAAPRVEEIAAPATGFLREVRADAVGWACLMLGAGRRKSTDGIDPAVGVETLRKTGDAVERGEPVFRIHARAAGELDEIRRLLRDAVVVAQEPVPVPPRILGAFREERRS